ncbi:unnamed protein product [Cutaneotrichosporon oleaginosum]
MHPGQTSSLIHFPLPAISPDAVPGSRLALALALALTLVLPLHDAGRGRTAYGGSDPVGRSANVFCNLQKG